MATVGWTPQALDDLEAACLFIARDAPRMSSVLAARVFDATDRLIEFPLSGRVVPEIGRSELREIFVSNYRVIYRVLPTSDVEILTIHHGARPLGSGTVK